MFLQRCFSWYRFQWNSNVKNGKPNTKRPFSRPRKPFSPFYLLRVEFLSTNVPGEHFSAHAQLHTLRPGSLPVSGGAAAGRSLRTI